MLSFKTADSEMMELLISPLYGDKPEVGIRELMQNSVDACSEFKDYRVKQGIQFEDNSDFDVSVTLYDYDEKGGKLVIEDYGIGMTLDVVENYFLNIGASFRNSDRWKREHETDGHSNVYRTGRFGIGLLAAYLLGDKLFVETRHVSQKEDQALSFECKKGSKSITVSQSEFHVGTRITIDIGEKVTQRLIRMHKKWDWYSLEDPRVERKIIDKEKERRLEQSRVVPISDANIEKTDWNRTIADGYDDITWTYSEVGKRNTHYGKNTSLICNGVIITEKLQLESFEISRKLNLIESETPTINVFDQDGRLPINLERSDLVGDSVPFKEEMAKDISRYLAKEMAGFCRALNKVSLDRETIYEVANVAISGLKKNEYGSRDSISKFLISSNLLIPLDYDLMAMAKVNSICVDAANLSKNRGAWTSPEFVDACENYLMVDKVSDTKQSRSGFVRTFFELNNTSYLWRSGISALPIKSRRILIRKNDVADVVSPGYVPKTFWSRLDCEWENEDWVLMSIGSVPPINFQVDRVANELTSSQSFGIAICYLDWDLVGKIKDSSLFSREWVSEIGGASFIGSP